jgi:hypothetical protein
MITLFYDANNIVNLIYYTDLPEELKNEKYLQVEELKEAEEKAGMRPVLMADETHYRYEYVEKELSPEQAFEQRLSDLEMALTATLGGEV